MKRKQSALLQNYSNPQPEAVSHGESSAPSVSNVPVNSSESFPTESSHFDITDLGTVTSLSSLSDEQRYQILINMGPKLKEYPANSQSDVFNPIGE